MANTLKVTDKIAAVAAEIFSETSYVAKNSMRSVEDDLQGAQKIGNSVRVKIPSRFPVNSDTFSNGKTAYSRGTRDAVTQETRTLTCNQSKWSGFDLTAEELAVFTGDDAKAMREIMETPVAALVRQTDIYMFDLMAKQGANRIAILSQSNGFTTDDASAMNSILAEQLASTGERKLALSAKDVHKAQVSAKGLFQSAEDIAKQYKSGVVSVGQGFDSWFNTQSLLTITIGTAFNDIATGRIEVNTNYVAGATSLVIKCDSTQHGLTLKAGQALEIESVYAIDPQTLVAVPRKATVIVQADATLSSAATTTLTVVPMYTSSDNITLANVSALPLANANISVVENQTGANSGKLAKVAIGWQKKAVAFATIPLSNDTPGADSSTQSADGVDIRIIRQYSAGSNSNANIMDIQFGGLIVRPEWVVSAVGTLA